MGNENKIKYLDEIYVNLTPLGDTNRKKGNVFLAQSRIDGTIVVKKYLVYIDDSIYKILVTINSRNIIRVYDYADDGSRGILIMEYISGKTLGKYIEEKGTFSENESCSIILELLNALEIIHKLGIVHRDVTPDNILISNDGIVKLIDFDISREIKENENHDTTILGTAGYAAPEQFGFSQTDERTDIYAVGVVMNKMLTGKLPNEKLYSNEKLREIIMHATTIDASNRFSKVADMISELELIQNPQHISEKRHEFIVWWLPGFRTGKTWKNIVATIGYLLIIIYSIVCMFDYGITVKSFLLELLSLMLYTWFAVLVTANVANWDRHLWPFKKFPKSVMIVIRIFICFFSFYGGIVLENYIRYTVLGLIKK